jgi:hypothetical protein
LLNVITIIADNEFHVVEGFYESVASNAETVLRVLGEAGGRNSVVEINRGNIDGHVRANIFSA